MSAGHVMAALAAGIRRRAGQREISMASEKRRLRRRQPQHGVAGDGENLGWRTLAETGIEASLRA